MLFILEIYDIISLRELSKNAYRYAPDNLDNFIEHNENPTPNSRNNHINTRIIYGKIPENSNPLHYYQCKFALIEKEYLNEFQLSKKHESLYKDNIQLMKPYWMTREGIDGIKLGELNYRTQSIRGIKQLINIVTKQNFNSSNLNNKELIEFNKYKKHPLYYMIPKSGSSSIMYLLKSYQSGGEVIASKLKHNMQINTNCGFTFVR